MAVSGVFDKLVSGLSLDERQSLLAKLKVQSNISDEPLYYDDRDTGPALDYEAGYTTLPWYYRLWYFIQSLFKARSPIDIFEERQISLLGEKIEERSPGLYDYEEKLLLPAFHRHLEKLKEAARFFYSALDTSVNRDKGAFFAFMGSLEMTEVHRILQEKTTPDFITEKYPEAPETELRQMAFQAMDDAFSLIAEEQRNTIYAAARSLNCLKGLSAFLYDRLLMAFNFSVAENGPICSVNVVRELLLSLNNILLSMKSVPPMHLLETLFVFILQEKAEEQGFDINRETSLLLAKAEEALAVIREFNKRVPLTWILRCAVRDMSLSPKEISGGEDWFVVYRDYWKRRIETLFSDFFRNRRRRELLNTFKYFLKGHGLKTLGNTASDLNPDGLPIKGSFALSFLLTFYTEVFTPDINKVLRPILIDGNFNEKEARVDFTESYNILIKLEDDIRKFEQQISTGGDYGKRYAQARQDMSSLQIKRRKIQLVLEEAEEDAERILDQVRKASKNMVNILTGILGKDPRNKYGPLSNLSDLAGRGNQFVNGLGESVLQFQKVVKLLDEIEAMEDGR